MSNYLMSWIWFLNLPSLGHLGAGCRWQFRLRLELMLGNHVLDVVHQENKCYSNHYWGCQCAPEWCQGGLMCLSPHTMCWNVLNSKQNVVFLLLNCSDQLYQAWSTLNCMVQLQRTYELVFTTQNDPLLCAPSAKCCLMLRGPFKFNNTTINQI